MHANHRADLFVASAIVFATVTNQLHLAMILVAIWIAVNNVNV